MPRLDIGAPIENAIARLEPLALHHAAGLRRAAEGAADAQRWTEIPDPEDAEAYLRRSLARAAGGAVVPFAQIEVATGEVVGHTTYLAPRWWEDGERLLAVEIGSTWLSPRVRGTAFNSAAKLALLGHAFDVLGVERVDLKTDARNARSRAAILAIGARLEGVLRAWQPSAVPGEEGLPRDTAMHSVLRAEWPAARAGLEARIAARAAAGA